MKKRTNKKDLPFFMKLMENLNKNNFKCPKPIKNLNGQYISSIKKKPAAMVSFLSGSSKNNLSALIIVIRLEFRLHNFTLITKKISIKEK